MPSGLGPERRSSLLAIGATAVVFAALLALTPPGFPTFDEAKYLGIGHRFLAGGGSRTIFGEIFLPHSPLWSVVLAVGDGRLGPDRYALGRLLNALSAVAFLGLVGWFAWRIRPYAAALAVAAFLWVPALMFDLAVTARLDVPAAALTLLYVAVGVTAVRRGSVPLALVAGLVFGLAFLVKEVVVPLAPVPILVGLAERRPWPWLARAGGLMALTAFVITSWWFVLVLDASGRVYRLDTPGWTLAPIAAVLVGASLLGIAAPHLAARRSVGSAVDLAAGARLQASMPIGIPPAGRWVAVATPTIVAWGLALAWAALLALFFGRIDELKGNGLFQPDQYALYLRTWLGALWPMALLAVGGIAIGATFAAIAWVGLARRPERDAAADGQLAALRLAALASLCGVPLVLLVIAVGEPPRNVLAEIGLGAAFAAGGWVIAASWAIGRLGSRRPQAGRVLGRWASLAAVAVVVGAVALGSLRLAGAAQAATSATDRLSAEIVRTTGAWLRDNVSTDARIGIGSYLSYNLALEMPDRALTQVQQSLAVFDPRAPLALATATNAEVDDWIAADVSRRALEFYAFRASALASDIRSQELDTLVYAVSGYTSVPALIDALTPDHGFERLQHWRWPLPGAAPDGAAIEVYVFRIDRDRLDFDGAALSITPTALRGLVELLESRPDSAAAAANLRRRVHVVPSSSDTDALLRRLDQLAGEQQG